MLPKGLYQIYRNLNKEINKIKYRTVEGLIDAAVEIRRDMDSTPPLIPVDLGNLKSSFFIVSTKGDETPDGFAGEFKGNTPSEVNRAAKLKADHAATLTGLQIASGSYKTVQKVFLGFTANYSAPVHEMIGGNSGKKKINWSRPGSGPKFFEASIKRNKSKVLQIVRDKAAIK